MPTIVGILTFMSRIKFMLSLVEHENIFITSGPVLSVLSLTDVYIFAIDVFVLIDITICPKHIPRGVDFGRMFG